MTRLPPVEKDNFDNLSALPNLKLRSRQQPKFDNHAKSQVPTAQYFSPTRKKEIKPKQTIEEAYNSFIERGPRNKSEKKPRSSVIIEVADESPIAQSPE